MQNFNLSAWAVRERAITLFFIFASACAGIYAYFNLGRGEDPSFTIKVLTVTAVWPGATAQEMQTQAAQVRSAVGDLMRMVTGRASETAALTNSAPKKKPVAAPQSARYKSTPRVAPAKYQVIKRH